MSNNSMRFKQQADIIVDLCERNSIDLRQLSKLTGIRLMRLTSLQKGFAEIKLSEAAAIDRIFGAKFLVRAIVQDHYDRSVSNQILLGVDGAYPLLDDPLCETEVKIKGIPLGGGAVFSKEKIDQVRLDEIHQKVLQQVTFNWPWDRVLHKATHQNISQAIQQGLKEAIQ